MKKFFLFIFILIFVFLPKLSSAQTLSIPGQIPDIEEQVSLDMNPGSPAPNEQVKLKLNAYGTDLSRAFISWKINGVRQKEGRGEQEFELNSGNIGTKTTIEISIKPLNGPLIEKTVSFTPQEVDLIWEARSYTPPFYRGKSFQGHLGEAVVVAIPNFKKENKQSVNSDSMKYTWQRNQQVVGESGGYQKNSFKFFGTILSKPEEIQVKVEDDVGGVARKFITITPKTPKVLLYENNPLYGLLFNKTSGVFNMQEKELSIVGMPMFFETSTKNAPQIEYSWKVNDETDSSFKSSSITLRNNGEKGVAKISLKARHIKNFLQEDSSQSIINITAPKSILNNFEF